jgi:hypothetical protein
VVLQLRTYTEEDGTESVALEPKTQFPKQHSFTSDRFTKLALAGVATLKEGVVKLQFVNGEAEYKIVYEPGDPKSEEKDAWVLELKSSNVGKEGAKKFKRPERDAVEAGDMSKEQSDRAKAHDASQKKGGK